MSRHMDLYGFSTYDPDIVDNAHILLCHGCPACQAAMERHERAYNRRHREPAY